MIDARGKIIFELFYEEKAQQIKSRLSTENHASLRYEAIRYTFGSFIIGRQFSPAGCVHILLCYYGLLTNY